MCELASRHPVLKAFFVPLVEQEQGTFTDVDTRAISMLGTMAAPRDAAFEPSVRKLPCPVPPCPVLPCPVLPCPAVPTALPTALHWTLDADLLACVAVDSWGCLAVL